MVSAILGGAVASLRQAVASRTVRFGFLATLLILLGSLSPAYLPQASPIWDVLYRLHLDGPVSNWVGTILTMAGLALLLDVWLRLRPARRLALGRPQLRHGAVLLVVALPLLLAPPTFSHDAYSYAAHGWLIHNGINPYDVGPGVLPGAFADQVAYVWRDTPAPYGPLALKLSHWLVVAAGFDPFLSTLAMRIPALFGVGLIGLLTPRIARWAGVSRSASSWFVVLNPILIIDFIGGMHNDALMVGLMLLGLWLAMRFPTWKGVLVGAAVVGVAAAIKQPAFLAAVALPFIARPWTSWRPLAVAGAAARAVVALLVSVVVFAGISVATGLGFGWVNAVNVPGMADTVSPFSVLGHIIQYPVNWLGLDDSGRAAIAVTKAVGVVVGAIGIAFLAARHLGRRPLSFLSWSFLTFAFTAPALHSWYVLWGGVLFPMTRPSIRWLRAAIIVTAILLGYAAMNFALRNGPWLLALLLIWTVFESLKAHELRQDWDDAPTQSPVRS